MWNFVAGTVCGVMLSIGYVWYDVSPPDWLESPRASYSETLARLLAISARGELVGLRPGAWSPAAAKGEGR